MSFSRPTFSFTALALMLDTVAAEGNDSTGTIAAVLTVGAVILCCLACVCWRNRQETRDQNLRLFRADHQRQEPLLQTHTVEIGSQPTPQP